jgi:glycosyltransferase involved in cell wall biosynthesis
MTRVVTITSIPLERDSRSFKFAASVARLGYESVVVEGERSRLLGDGLPFELISPPNSSRRLDSPEPAESQASEDQSLGARIANRLPQPVAILLKKVHIAYRTLVGPPQNALFILRLAFRELRRANRETSALLPDADVYWLHSFFQFPAVYLKSRRLGARFLYDTPDAYWEPGVSPTTGRVLPWVMRAYEWIEKRSVRSAEAVTSVSDGIADVLERRFGRRPQVVRNAHDLRLDQPSEGDVRASAEVGEDEFLLVVVGNNKPELMADEMLLALQKLPGRVHIAFVGRNHEGTGARAEELGLGDRVHVLGHVPPTQIVSFIRTADAAPVLSRGTTENDRASLPNKFFHAIAAGLPVLYPPLPEMAALAERHQLGVEIDPADPDSVAAGVRAMVGEAGATARYRANVERARETLSWEQEERTLAEILDGNR